MRSMSVRRCWPMLLALLFASCAGNVPTAGTVTVALDQPPGNLDPRVGTDAVSQRLTELVFSSLVRRDETSAIVGDLAVSWDIPDPVTYVFHLRPDVRFHDGRLLTSRDVVYTFRSILDRSIQTAKAGTYAVITSVDAPDDRTVRFRLSEPYAPFLWNLTVGAIGIVPEGATAQEVRDSPVGSGPFRFVHYRRDDEILLERNTAYFGTPPEVGGARFRIIPDAVSRALELRKGTVDIALNVLPPDMVETLGESPELEVMNTDGSNYQYLAFNLDDPLLRDRRIREAIAHAIDREAIVRYLWRGQARLADSLLPPENWAYFDGVTRYGYDPERARRLLEEAGQPDLTVTYKTATDTTALLVASVLQEQLRQVGIRMEIRSYEFATFYSDIIAGSFQMYSLRWIGGNNDPDIFNLVFHSAMTPPNGANRGRYRNAEVDAWIELARRESDIRLRQTYYADVQKAVSDELPYVSLWYLNNVAVYNRRIQGIRLDAAGNYGFLVDVRIGKPE